jgi:hypothetical protein
MKKSVRRIPVKCLNQRTTTSCAKRTSLLKDEAHTCDVAVLFHVDHNCCANEHVEVQGFDALTGIKRCLKCNPSKSAIYRDSGTHQSTIL